MWESSHWQRIKNCMERVGNQHSYLLTIQVKSSQTQNHLMSMSVPTCQGHWCTRTALYGALWSLVGEYWGNTGQGQKDYQNIATSIIFMLSLVASLNFQFWYSQFQLFFSSYLRPTPENGRSVTNQFIFLNTFRLELLCKCITYSQNELPFEQKICF